MWHGGVGIRDAPTLVAARVGRLEPNSVFEVDKQEYSDEHGVMFLHLADGTGWVFDRSEARGVVCEKEKKEPVTYKEMEAYHMVIKSNDVHDLYQTSHGLGELITGSQRFRIVYSQLLGNVNLDYAQQIGIIKDWYPAHSLPWLQRLGQHWARLGLIWDYSFVQPMDDLYMYFGARIAFIFSWNGVYCKGLLAIAPLALMWHLGQTLGESLGYGDAALRQVLCFTLIIIMWCRIVMNLYDRETDFYLKKWGLNADGEDGSIIRAEFEGEMVPSDYDLSVTELQFSASSYAFRRFVSSAVSFVFICFVGFCVYLWVTLNEGKLNFVASILLTIQIKVFEFIFNQLSGSLTDWENHKYASHYYNSLLSKQCMFAFVNSYWAFIFLAVKQRFTLQGCPEGGCLAQMRSSLTLTMLILSIVRIVEVWVVSLLVRVKLWLEDRALKKEVGTDAIPERTFIEEQGKFASYRMKDQITAMLQLVIPLGYVILFGGVAPIIVFYALAVFAVQLRATAFLLVTSSKRPVPRKSLGLLRIYGDITTLKM